MTKALSPRGQETLLACLDKQAFFSLSLTTLIVVVVVVVGQLRKKDGD